MRMPFPWAKPSQDAYERVHAGEDGGSKEALLDDRESETTSFAGSTLHHAGQRHGSRKALFASLALNATLVAALLVISVPTLRQRLHDPFHNALLKQTSMPSPIFDQMHIPLSTQRRNGSLLPDNPPSLYRQDPSDEVDAAWDRLTNINPIPISSQDVRNIGYDPEIVARWPEEYGLGDDAFVARLDVFHEIHCLNMLRKEINFEYYNQSLPSQAKPDHRVHVSHCIHALLQSLMCSANTDPFIHYWVDIGDEPYPDFSINRQCRDFDAVLQWQEQNSIPMGQFRNVIRKPEGVAPRIMSLEYKYMLGLIKQDPAVNLTAAKEESFKPILNGAHGEHGSHGHV